MIVAIVNQSTLFSNADAGKAARAIDAQTTEVGVAWEVFPPSVVLASDEAIPEGAEIVRVFDDSDQAGALGYHGEDADGHPYARVFARGLSALSGSDSVSAVLSHEVLEMMIDPAVQMWAQSSGTLLFALEACDPVESDSYEQDVGDGPVALSNYVTPAWFDEASDKPRDRMGTTPGAFELAPGGYCVVMVGGEVSQQYAKTGTASPLRADHKRRAGSRTARRLGMRRAAGPVEAIAR